jgi:aspartate/glutamate racemase
LLADPFLGLQSAVITLLRAGCEKICIVCNTAHLWLPELQAAFPMVEFISIIETSIQAIQARQIKEVILLATTGTIQSKLYGKALEAAGIRVHPPNSEQQAKIDQGIYGDPTHGLGGVKTGDVLAGRQAFEGVAWEILQSLARERNLPVETLLAQGHIGLGFFCTEIGVAVTDQALLEIAIDSTKELAMAMRKIAKQTVQ